MERSDNQHEPYLALLFAPMTVGKEQQSSVWQKLVKITGRAIFGLTESKFVGKKNSTVQIQLYAGVNEMMYYSYRCINYKSCRIGEGVYGHRRRPPRLSSKSRCKLRFLNRIHRLPQLFASPLVNFTPPMRLKSSISLVISVKPSDNVD